MTVIKLLICTKIFDAAKYRMEFVPIRNMTAFAEDKYEEIVGDSTNDKADR